MMSWLFDSVHFVTRNHCGAWTPPMISISRMANLLIFVAYFSIPLALISFWKEIRKSPKLRDALQGHAWILVMFFLFIFSCGLTHLCDVLVFDWAPYRFFTLVDILTAVFSIPTAVVLPGVLRELLAASK